MTSSKVTVRAAEQVLRDFMKRLTVGTANHYLHALKDFGKFLPGSKSAGAALAWLLSINGSLEAIALVNAYKQAMAEQDLPPVTINLHLSALRGVVCFAKNRQLIGWHLVVKGLPRPGGAPHQWNGLLRRGDRQCAMADG